MEKTKEEILAEERARQAALAEQAKKAQQAVSTADADQTTKGKTTSVQQSSGSSVSVGNQSGRSRSESQMELTPEAQQAEREARDAYMQSHGYVKAPDGTWKLNQTLFDALNIPREDLRKERERQQKENRMKQLVSGLYHSGALLSDMISAGVGGNVWKREKDDTAEKAAAENKQLRTLQLAEDAAFAEKQRKDMQDTLDKAQQQADQRRRELMKTVSTQTHRSNSGQQSVQNSTSVGTQTSVQGSTTSDDFMRRQAYWHSFGNNTKDEDVLAIKMHTANGEETVRLPIGAKRKESIANELANVLTRLPDYETKYKEYVTTKGSGLSAQDVADLDRLINDGVYLENPNIMNTFLNELEKSGFKGADGKPFSRAELYEAITGENIFTEGPIVRIDPTKVIKGVTLNGVKGTKISTSGDFDWFGK